MSKKNLPGWLLLLFLMLFLSGQATATGKNNQGFIYGRVVTESGSEYNGFLRWGDQESFWDDLFHSAKEDLPYFDYLDDDDYEELRRGKRRKFSFFEKLGFTIDDDDDYFSRIFVCRFGDIDVIEPKGDSDAVVRMKNGKEYDVSGYSDDVTSSIHVNDESMGEIDLRWDRIESVEFFPAPKDADPGVWRLYGVVETREGDFKGYIQWDQHECLSIDELDGDTEDGDVSIEMGRIRSIERLSKRRSMVVLKDERKIRMHGTNDVNHENRGIMVEDPRFGRVTVGWDSFERLNFMDPPGSGLGYGDYPIRGSLVGTVTDDDGEKYVGRIVFDLDESEEWEILNGNMEDIEFDIPFHRIATVEPSGRSRCFVVLKNNEELTLEDTQDVGRKNSGVLIFVDDEKDPFYVRWKDVERIEFD